MGQRKGNEKSKKAAANLVTYCLFIVTYYCLFATTCRKRKPRTNTTKYEKNGNKKTKKVAANPHVEGENAAVQEENVVVQPLQNVVVHSEDATAVAIHYENVVVQPPENIVTAKATIMATSPGRVTRR